MDNDELKDKLDNIEKRIQLLEEKTTLQNDNSIIAFVLDTFNVKKFLETIFQSQNRFKFTQNFIYLMLLFIFLSVIFWITGILKIELSAGTGVLAIIIIAGILELLGANTGIFTGIFKKWFNNDIRTADFFKNLPGMTPSEALSQLNTLNFSNECVESFIKSIKNNDTYNIDLLDNIFKKQPFSFRNMDLLFTEDTLKCLDDKPMERILSRYGRRLSSSHMENVYKVFKDNDKIMKLLITTNERSNELIKTHPNDKKIEEYYDKYQIKKIHRNLKLKISSSSKYTLTIGAVIAMGIPIIIFLILFIPLVNGGFLNTPIQHQNQVMESVSIIVVFSFLFLSFPIMLITRWIAGRLEESYYNLFIKTVTSKTIAKMRFPWKRNGNKMEMETEKKA